jgi:hypothetical protein
MSTGCHFQNGHHNTAQIQHCPISTTFHMWVDYDVPNWLLTSKNVYRSPFSKWPPQYRTNTPKLATDNRFKKYIKSYLWNWTMLNVCGIVAAILKMETGRHFSISGINSGRWNRAMLYLCGIVEAILKMATGRHFSMSVINSGHQNLPTYVMALKSDTPQYRTNSTLSEFNAISYVGRLWCPELIPDIEKCLPVAISKMATTIPHKFNIVRFLVRYCGGHFGNGNR